MVSRKGEAIELEFAGAMYHVISRGNYRKKPFEDGSACATF